MIRKTIFFCLLFFLSSFVFCDSDPLVGEKKISMRNLHQLIDTLVSSYAQTSELSPQILRKSRENLLQTFDPERIYLLDDEVEKFLDERYEKMYFKEYQEGHFSVYGKMLEVIQGAIIRSREIRRGFFFTDAESLDRIRKESLPKYATYAGDKTQLVDRIFHEFVSSIVRRLPENKENDPESVKTAVAVAEKEFEEHEKDYLRMRIHGTKEQEELFASLVLKSIVSALDSHSDMLSSESAKETRARLLKTTFGSGVICRIDDDGCCVSKIIKGSPADRLGSLFPEDVITKIDGKNVSEMTDEEIEGKLSNAPSDIVDLTIVRAASSGVKNTINVSIPKREFTLEEERVTSRLYPSRFGNILYLDLFCFYHGSDTVSSKADIEKAIGEALKKGPIAGIILDLRKNGGGYINEAVSVAGLFIKTGVIMESVYSDGTTLIFRDTDRSVAFSGPMIVLTSYWTASAAEIVAQALRDYGRAIIVGDAKTYGKGSIQMQTVTDVSQSGAWFEIPMRITVGNFYTVSGKSPQGGGVDVDIVLPSVEGRKGIEKPLSAKKAFLPPLFYDTLGDINVRTIGWYKEHYLPYLEKRSDVIRKYIPDLQKKSKDRIEKNPIFVACKGPNASTAQPSVQEVKDAQMEEALFIMNDLLFFLSKGS